MRNRSVWLVSIAAGLILASLGLHRATRLKQPPSSVPAPVPVAAQTRTTPRLPAPRVAVGATPAEAEAPAPATNLLTRLAKGEELPKLTLEQVRPYLAANQRNAESLLAAHFATGDKALLEEAMEKYPKDPRVAYAAWFRSESAEARRQWLDAFKQAAPDNALAYYLSANEHFKSGQTDEAIVDLETAATKTRYRDYTLEAIQSGEEAYRSAGYSELDARLTASANALLPQLAQLKQLGRSLIDLSASYRQAGDEASAQASLQMGLSLGQRLSGSEGTLIQDLVGIAVEKQILATMDPGSQFGNTGQTVKARLDALTQQRQEIKILTQQSSDLLAHLPDSDQIAYFDRLKLFGEQATMRWLVNKYGTSTRSN